MIHDLKRFEAAQKRDFKTAFMEIKAGKKVSHWMWYIFPQIKGLGFSETTKLYSIQDIEEAKEFLNHPILGQNLRSISSELLNLTTNNATMVFGKPDDKKLQSSMTLFSMIPGTDPVFQKVLDKYFSGEKDLKTIGLVG
jgi:uncharacterized protein (DUF1810 family)